MAQPLGGIYAIGVGHGKTLIALLLPCVLGAKRPLYLCPARLRDQYRQQFELWRLRYPVTLSKIMGYEMLSSPRSTAFIEEYAPDLVIADESHKLKNAKSVRSSRLFRHQAPLFCLSGSMTSQNINEFAHLSSYALGEQSPIPRSGADLYTWHVCSSAKGYYESHDVARIQPLLRQYPSLGTIKERTRTAIYEHISTSKGYIMTTEQAVDTPLSVDVVPIEMPDSLQTMIAKVLETNETPDGDLLADPLDAPRIAKQLCHGFWYRWDWHGVDDRVKTEWYQARAAWINAVRDEIDTYGGADHDSPALIERYVLDGKAPWQLTVAYKRWKYAEVLCAPTERPVWVSSYLIDYARHASYMTGAPLLVWTTQRPLCDRLILAGFAPSPTIGDHCALMVQQYGEGFNMPQWHNNLVLYPMSGGLSWEQMIARTHRPGQTHPVSVTVLIPHSIASAAFTKAKASAKYTEEITKQPQKLLIGLANASV